LGSGEGCELCLNGAGYCKPTGSELSVSRVDGKGDLKDYYYLDILGPVGHPLHVILRSSDGYHRDWEQFGQLYTDKIHKPGSQGRPVGATDHVQVQDLTTGDIAFFKFPCEPQAALDEGPSARAPALSQSKAHGQKDLWKGSQRPLWKGSGDVTALLRNVVADFTAAASLDRGLYVKASAPEDKKASTPFNINIYLNNQDTSAAAPARDERSTKARATAVSLAAAMSTAPPAAARIAAALGNENGAAARESLDTAASRVGRAGARGGENVGTGGTGRSFGDAHHVPAIVQTSQVSKVWLVLCVCVCVCVCER
jgi:hypothetical protein